MGLELRLGSAGGVPGGGPRKLLLGGECGEPESVLRFYCNLVSGSELRNTESVFKSMHCHWEHKGQLSPGASGNQTGERGLKVGQAGLGLDIPEKQDGENRNQQGLGIASSRGGF